jgi:hypothetical protein
MRYLIFFLYTFLSLQALALNEVDKAQLFNKNLLVNGGFENGKAKWTASAGTFAVTSSSPMEGLYHSTWDAAASGNTLTTTAVAIPAGMYGRNGAVTCLFTTASGTATHEIQAYDGSNVLSEVSIVSSTTPTRASANFIFPSSGNIQLRIYANADEPSVAIDSCFVGPAEGINLGGISQAALAGESYFAGTASCTGWTRASATIGALGTDADCPGPTIVTSQLGSWATTDSDLPRQTITNLPPGVYIATFQLPNYSTATSNSVFAIYDGSTTCAGVRGTSDTSVSALTVTCSFTYTNAGNRAFELYAASASSTINVSNDVTSPAGNVKFTLVRYPLASETAYTPDKMANSWSGYHDSTCSWARTNTAYGDPTADASCALVERTNANFGTVSTSGSVLPAITFTPSKKQRYYVCANAQLTAGTNGVFPAMRLWDGTTVISEAEQGGSTNTIRTQGPLCGIYSASSVSAVTLSVQTKSSSGSATISATASNSSIEWSIFSIDNSIPAPLLVNSVVSPREGVTRICSGFITGGGSTTITRSDGNCLASLVDNGTGDTTLTFATGTFSSTPNCICTAENGNSRNCEIDATTATSSTTVRIQMSTDAGAASDESFSLICIGPK